jgi:predicted PurR-regulated permease PerM
MLKKYNNVILVTLFLLCFSISFFYLYGIFLPFILGMLLAFSVYPAILRIQKIVKNRNLATTIFLAIKAGGLILFLIFCTRYINRDFKRLNQSFIQITKIDKEKLNKTAQKVNEYIADIYDFESLKKSLKYKSDSVISGLKNMDYSQLDTESIKSGFEKLTSVFHRQKKEAETIQPSFSFTFIFFSTIGYFILILFHLDYFIKIREKYFGGKIKSIFHTIIDDFNKSFVKYFKLRTKIVLLLSPIYLVSFIILDMPGTILITLLIVLLSYISYLQYIALIPLSVGCLILSVENPHGFLFYFCIVLGIFILASIIEELILTPRIMEKNIGINPVIITLAISVWSYLLGIPGLLLAIPMTGLIIILFKQYFLHPYQEVFKT